MGKIVCEVCGAAYPETSSRCPVCGSVRYSTPEPISDVIVDEQPEWEDPRPISNRHTKENVKKRRKRNKKNAQLVRYIAIGCGLLLLLILLLTLVLTSCDSGEQVDPTEVTTEPTEEVTQEPTGIPCVNISLNVATVSFTELGQTFLLTATCEPEGTTDFVVFTSDDPTVVAVDESGELVAVAPGTANITVICGNVSAVCEVVCAWEDATEEPTLPPETLVLNRSDFTLSYKGATWQVYSGVIDVSLIKFSSENEAVATIVDGKVTAVGRGTTKVYAEFGEQKVECIVRCSFKDDTTSEGNGGVEEDTGTGNTPTTTGIAIYSQWNKVLTDDRGNGDVSLKIGEKIELFLRDASGKKITVEWSVSKEGYVTIDGTSISGAAKGTIVLTAVHEEKEYKCIIRVI